ncbi:MAG: hypothetical protein HY261_00565 [Chloroflexi bacterium]|nr:hypothetical protein [Chloroflexota bacterium]
MFDGIWFEKKGIPAVVLCTEPFIPTAKSMARIQGIPDYRFVVLPHPVGSLPPDDVRERAKQALPQIIDILMAQQPK